MSLSFSGPASPSRTRRSLVMALPLLGCGLWGGGLPGSPSAWAGSPDTSLRDSRSLMGTRVDIAAQGPDAALLRNALDQAYAEMQRLEALMSRYRPDSAVSLINFAAGISPVAVPPEVMAVLQSAQRVSTASQGAFDVTIGALKTWQFGPGAHVLPTDREIAQQLPLVGAHGLVLDARAGTAFLARRGMALDLGGIAKLPILEAGLGVLRALGVQNAMVNGGGDVLAEGLWHGRPWRVGLRDPRAPERLLGVVTVKGAGVVASSGDYERYFLSQGQRMHHVLNPRTGRPSAGVHGVSLVASSVAAVNGLGAALMVQGKAAGQALARKSPDVGVLMAGADGSVWTSPSMAARLEPAVS
ncbi:FAD:protein FMN transferase [Acidovorax sp. BL-A-41-H1]|uniref:FAD:protein FMN transferase n=1 Tax=Acidovorax sp. BL-A-41-H1 TaxID=3421102 RepID=UPI003F7A4FD6